MIMDVPQKDLEEIIAWLDTHDVFERAWIFGSRAMGDSRPDSDLDLAIQHGAMRGDSNAFTTSIAEAKNWRAELQPRISLELDLQSYIPGDTEVVEQGLKRCSVLIWERSSNKAKQLRPFGAGPRYARPLLAAL